MTWCQLFLDLGVERWSWVLLWLKVNEITENCDQKGFDVGFFTKKINRINV